ncbi:phosphotransferase family protein [Qaidamihabitans albus]|uniref:phosphotransferase family protein n=1 Tax=Qaidamihabitans albus TaxID=2795733 RepID=UPI0018F203D3|nr:phosphotransferase family protein [Qaidamihabitans albus]
MSDVGAVGIDEGAAAQWITSLGFDVTGDLRFERIGLGQSNLTFLVRDDTARTWVLRRPPLGELLASAHDVQREARILAALEGTDVPVPEVYGVCHDPAVSNAPLVLMEFVDGLVVDTLPAAETWQPAQRRSIGLSLARTLADVHRVDLDATGLVDLASHKPYAGRQLKRWSGQWERSRTRDQPKLDELTGRLTAAVPDQHELSLVHGDFHLRNVITSPDADVAAVLDWELCTLGDPLADLGTLLAYWPERAESEPGEHALSAVDGFPGRDELVAEYVEASGRDTAALGFWHALGLWKIAIIAEGVLRRSIDEPRNKAAAAGATVDYVDELIERADKMAAAAGI